MFQNNYFGPNCKLLGFFSFLNLFFAKIRVYMGKKDFLSDSSSS